MLYKYIYLLVGIEYTEDQITTSLVQLISATLTSTLTSSPTSTPTSFKLPLKRRRTEAGEISVTLNKILESRNLMLNQMTGNNDIQNDIKNINNILEKVEADVCNMNNKLDKVVNDVHEIDIKLEL